jgi:outer membrane protein OmpA-like peptidoglycan-associated protein
MKPGSLRTACVLLLMALLLGCSTRGDLIVLLPDEDGKVGRVEVTNKGGAQILAQANQAVAVRGPDIPPDPPVAMQPERIESLFGPAMAARPAAPAHFILYFESQDADLQTSSRALVPEILEAIRKRASTDILVIGHTDRTGSEQFNRRLSLQRAKRVRQVLVENGVDPEAITVDYHGEGAPLVVTEDGVPEPLNRRVEVVVR